MGSSTAKCPNYNNQVRIYFGEFRGKEFPCASCAAILKVPRRNRVLLMLGFLSTFVIVVPSVFISAALTGVTPRSMDLETNSIPLLVMLLTFFPYPTLAWR